jgi:hypothetical protein
MSVVKPPSAKEEDELDELPPIDGDGDADEDDASGAVDEELDENADDPADPLDDSTGEGDSLPEIEVAGSESGWLDDAGDSEGLDVGTPETFGGEEDGATLLEGAEEADDEDEDLAFGSEGESIVADAGEEGFAEEGEDLREEDLPRLDSGDDDVEPDDADLALPEGLQEDEVDDEPRPPWDDRAWERADGDAIAAVSALACTPEGVVVGGEGIAWVDAAGKATALDALGLRGGAPFALASDGAWVLVATPRAGVLASRDKGRSFAEANSWRALVSDEDARDGNPLQLAMSGGDLWARTKSGALLWSGDRGATWARPLADKRFDAIACDASSGELVAVARIAGAAESLLARGSRGRVTATACAALPRGAVLALAAEGGHVALAVGRRGVFRAEGDAWSRLEGTAAVTAITYARGGTLLVALGSESDGRAWLVEARGGDGPARIVAELGDPAAQDDETDSRVGALAWDDVRAVVWAAGAFGLAAMRPARH